MSQDVLVPWLGGPRRASRGELVIAFGALLLLAVGVYLPHAFTGGFYTDDWFFQAAFHFTGRGPGSIPEMLDVGPFPGDYRNPGSFVSGYRPLQTVMLAGQYVVAGDSRELTLALAPALVAIQTFLLYLVLRMLGVRVLVAGLVAGLLAIGTFVDTTRLWSTAYPEMNAVSLYLGGLACALRGLRSVGRRSRLAWHGAAAALYVASALTYEAFLALIPLSFLAYLVVSDRRSTLRRLAVDLGAFCVGVATVALTASSERGGEFSPAHLWGRLKEVVPGAVDVLRASLPFDSILWGPAGLLLLLAAGVGVAVAIRRGGPPAHAARQWCLIAVAAVGLAFVGLGPLLPGQVGLAPDEIGFANRFLTVSSAFYAVILVAGSFLAAIGFAGLVRRPALALPLALLGVAVIAAHLVREEIGRQDDAGAAWEEEQRILDRVEVAVPDPAPAASLVTVRHPIALRGGMVSFGAEFDLDGALKLRYDDRSIEAHPFLPDGVCGPDGVIFNQLFADPQTLGYERLYFVDVPTARSIRIDSRARCEQVVASLRLPGARGVSRSSGSG